MPFLIYPRFIRLCCVLLLLLVARSVSATHIVGADMYYTHITGNTYKITLVLYGDCGPASYLTSSQLPYSTPEICVYNGNTNVGSLNLTINPPSLGLEVTPVCPDSLHYTQCVNTSNPIPGIKKFVYTGNYTLPYASSVWRFIYNGNPGPTTTGSTARAAAITNIAIATSGPIQLIDTLNNLTAPNSSPIMSVIPVPFYCLNQYNGYNPGAVDADGDRLVFSLIDAAIGTSNCVVVGGNVTYVGNAWPGQPITATTPLQCVASSYFFDTLTGQIQFYPNFVQRSIVVYNIREFRGGVLVGTCQREMTFLVRPCSNLPPAGVYDSANAGTLIDSTHFEICANSGPFSIFINPTDPEGHNVFIDPIGLPPGATFTTTGSGTPTPHCTFSWNSNGVAPGVYIFYLTFRDNTCPVIGTFTRAFVVTITPTLPPIAGVAAMCPGGTVPLSIATTGGTWSVTPVMIATVTPTTGVVTGISPGTATVTYSSSSGCRSFAVVTVDPITAGTISGPSLVCPGDTISLTPPVAVGTWSTAGSAVTISPSGVVTGITPGGTATISYTSPTMCGVVSYLYIVTVNTLPTVNPITGPTNVCVGSIITLANSTPGGAWSTASTTASVNSAGGVTGVSGGTALISYTVGNICDTISTTYIVTVDTPLMIHPIAGPDSVCMGASITLSSSLPGGIWSVSPAAVATITSSGVLLGVSGGTATVSYTLSNSCGAASATTVVTVMTLPVVSPILGPSSVCLGNTVTLTCTPAGGMWSSTGSGTVSATGVVTAVSGGIAIISYSLSNTCGTTAVVKAVTVNLFPDAGSISGPDSVCQGSAIVLTPSIPGGTWSTSSPGVTVSASGLVNGITSGTALITYTLTNGCGPADTTYLITVNPTPVAGTISGTAVLCVGGTVTLSSTTPGGVWSASGVATVLPGGVVTGTAPGTANISYTVTLGACAASAGYIVTVNSLPEPGIITADSVICIGATITVIPSVPGGVWSCSNAAISVSSSGTVTGMLYGSATLTYTVSNMCGPSSVTKVITVFPPPDPGTITGDSVICLGNVILLTGNSTIGTGTWVSSNPSVATVDLIGNVTSVATGTAVISYKVVGFTGCIGIVQHIVTVAPLPNPGVISGIKEACLQASVTLAETEAGGAWSSSNTSVAQIDPLTGKVTIVGSGTTTITYTSAPNSYGCANIATHRLSIFSQAPFYINEALLNAHCYNGADGSISVWASHGAGPWSFQWGHGANTADVSGLYAGRYEVYVTDIITACKAYEAYTISQPDSLVVQISVKDEKCFMANGAASLDVWGGTAPYTYKWYNNSTANNIAGLAKGQYPVSVSDKNECKRELVIDVVEGGCDDIGVSDGFSPNQDGSNDYWVIRGIENYVNNFVQLFDKWGDLVYEKRNYDNHWDGTGRTGKPLPDGTYFYVIKLNAENAAGGENVITGALLIKR